MTMFDKPLIRTIEDLQRVIELAKAQGLELLTIGDITIRPAASIVYVPQPQSHAVLDEATPFAMPLPDRQPDQLTPEQKLSKEIDPLGHELFGDPL